MTDLVEILNENAGAITGVSTIALLLVTGLYAWTTHRLFGETRATRLMASTPRVVGYLRVHAVHSNMVSLHVANLSEAAACKVTARITAVTDWPKPFELEGSTMLRDISFVRPNEVIIFDVGIGPDLFHQDEPAIFDFRVDYESLDARSFSYNSLLKIESVMGFGTWRVYGIDDVARRLEKIQKAIEAFTGFKRMKVDTFTARDRLEERREREKQREEMRKRDMED